MPRPLSEQVVVITGASSGIGRATALAFAREGASVVLSARGPEALESAAQEISRLGGQALAVQADVGRWQDVERLAEQAVASYGRIDTWVNNAAISEYATVEETAPEEFERIIQVNLLGQIFGSRAALLAMKRQGNGTIINVASALALRSVPLQAAYSASKHGVKGFTEALRIEVARAYPEISVCLVLPSSINTPLFSHARSKQANKPMPIPPVYEPAVVAQSIVHVAQKPQAELVVGGSGKLFTVMERISPGLVDWYLLQKDRGVKQQLSGQPDDRKDNLFAPLPEKGRTTGDFGEGAKAVSLYTKEIDQQPRRKALALLGVLAGAIVLAKKVAR